MLERLTIDDFERRVNGTFSTDFGEHGVLQLELIKVRPLTERPPEAGERRPFAIELRGPAEPVLAQRIYPLDHGELGALEIFLVPIGPDRAGMLYEAVFT